MSTISIKQSPLANIPFLSIEPLSPYKKSDFKKSATTLKPIKTRSVKTKLSEGKEQTTLCVYRSKPESSLPIFDTASFLDYALKWVKTVYPTILFYPIHNSGTLLVVFSDKSYKFIQFIYKDDKQSLTQEFFKSTLPKEDFCIFRKFKDFCNWMYEKTTSIK